MPRCLAYQPPREGQRKRDTERQRQTDRGITRRTEKFSNNGDSGYWKQTYTKEQGENHANGMEANDSWKTQSRRGSRTEGVNGADSEEDRGGCCLARCSIYSPLNGSRRFICQVPSVTVCPWRSDRPTTDRPTDGRTDGRGWDREDGRSRRRRMRTSRGCVRDCRPVMQRNDLVVRFMCPSLVDLSHPGIRDQRRRAPPPPMPGSFEEEHASSDRHRNLGARRGKHEMKGPNGREGNGREGDGRREMGRDGGNDESDR